MEKLHKPDASRQDYYAFVNELKLFHQNRGTPFRNVPKINGREIDLQKLYNQVTALGGLQKVIDGDKWDVVAEVLNLPKACANFSLGLRQIYIRYLAYYEKIHFLGEDPDHDKNHASESHNRKLQLTLLHHVPMLYNSLQHDITDIARSTSGLNQKFINPTDYDKLCMSLLCGLPNEQEMALNVCTILSNEGNYMLHLEHCPKLVKLLVAQAGIFPLDDNSLKFLYLQSWKGLKGRNMERFWRNTLQYQDSSVVQLLDFDLGDNDPNDSLLNLESDLGVLNVEGQRALRVALILHNLSFEKNNIPVLVADKNCIRFLLLSVYSSWTNLKQTAYDTLSNIACEIKLSIEKDIFSRIIFQTVMKGIVSSDRYMNIRSMDILSQLCSYEPNEEIIPSRVDVEVYQHMVSFLSVHDIMLLIFTLEALYALSDLGRYACEKIVCVHRSIGVLVSLLTLDHNQYGPQGLIKMKVVETLVPSEFEEEPEEKTVTSPEAVTPSKELDSETFTVNWLKSSFEFLPGYLIPRNELYSEYVSYCSKVGRKNPVNTNIFAGFVKSTYPQSVIKRVESGNGPVTIYHDGLKRKENGIPQPAMIKSTVLTSTPCKSPRPTTPVSSKPGPKQTHSPILKAQLSAPPRSTSPPLKRLTEHAANLQKSSFQPIRSSSHVSTINTPTSNSSTLIKSLLATKVQQRNLHRQVIPQGFSKMVIYSTDKVRGQVVRTPTLLRCGRPATFTPPVRGPFQARIISSKGRIITSAPPRLKNPDVERPSLKCPSKLIKQCPPRLNGIPRDVHMEVCRHAENANNVKDASSYSKNHINNDLLDSKDCISCDGDNALSSKSMEIDNDYNKNGIQQEKTIFCKVSENNENIVLTNNVLVMKQKSSSDLLNSSIGQNGSNISSISSNDATAICEEMCPSKSVPPSSKFNSVIHNIDDSLDNTIKIQKDIIYKKAPLLNGLLDKGKLQVLEENHLTSLLQNGIKDIPMEVNISKSTLPVQFSNSANTVISEKSVIPSCKPSITRISLNTSSTSSLVTSPSSTLHSSFNSVTSQSSNLPIATMCLPNCVQSSSSNLSFPTSTISNSVTNSLLNNSVETTSVNFVMPTMNVTSSSSNLVSQSRMTNISLTNQTVQSSKFSDSSKFLYTSNSNLCNSSNSVTTFSSNSAVELSSNLSSEQSSNMVVEKLSTPLSESPLYSSIEISPNPLVKNSLYQNSQSSTDSKTQPSTSATMQTHSVNTTVQTILTNTITQTITTSSSLESNSISSETTSSQSVFPFMTNCISTISSVPSVITTSVMSPTAFHSEGDHLLKICTGQATLSGTIEVQPDQKGVVRLHIESPENSNQGSDLSSISDITRTLECASKALSETNAESSTEIPHCGTIETTATVTVITTNTPTLSRAGQQIIVVTPSLNQPQLHIQSPNIKFRILHSLPKAEEHVDSVDFSHVHLNQINQFKQPSLDSPSLSASTLKRPSSNVSLCMDVKKPRMDTKTPLLEASLRLPAPVPCSVTSNVNTKSVTHENILITNTSVENSQKYSESSPKLNTIKAVPVQNIDIPSEKETKTFSGLSSICDNPSLAAPSQVPSKSTSKIEFLCEWKDCGLKFPNPSSVFLHATKVHAPMCNEDMICLWEGCDSMKRKRFSLLTHLQDWHCNEKVLHIQALRRKQLSHQGKTSISPPQMPPPHPGYAPDAAFLAIRRHALQYINPKELSEDKESALTKSIRLTSALILRNLVTHSSLARTYVRRFESELAYLAMSPVESARTIAQCLSELSRSHD